MNFVISNTDYHKFYLVWHLSTDKSISIYSQFSEIGTVDDTVSYLLIMASVTTTVLHLTTTPASWSFSMHLPFLSWNKACISSCKWILILSLAGFSKFQMKCAGSLLHSIIGRNLSHEVQSLTNTTQLKRARAVLVLVNVQWLSSYSAIGHCLPCGFWGICCSSESVLSWFRRL
jgi:hypothetical protein